MAFQMFPPKIFALYFIVVLIPSSILLSTCSETSEYGEASDYEKLGASCVNSTGDSSAPTISKLIPSDNSTNVPVASKIVVTFSDAMLEHSITTNTADTKCSGSFQLSSDDFSTCIRMSDTPMASDNDTTFTVTPASSLSLQTNYKFKITTSVVENSCNKMATDNTSNNGFTTAGAGSGTIKGLVTIASNGNALSGVNVQFYGTTIDNTSTNSDGEFNTEVDVGDYTITYSKDGYIDESQDVPLETDNQTLEVQTITMLSTGCASGTISGNITDAVSGGNVSGVSLQIKKGYWQAWNPVEATTTTDSSGNYSFGSMDAGGYTVYTSKSGYINGRFTVYSCGNVSNQDYAISTTLPNSNSMRIILSWPAGATGDDLDSHIQFPDNSSNAYHLHWARNTGGTGQGMDYYVYGANDNVTLDRDETDAPGTETITVITARSGDYSYSVHDWSNKADNNSTDLSKSKATVTVYLGSSLPGSDNVKKYTVPSGSSTGGKGNLWRVFTFTKSGGLVKVHELTNVSTSSPTSSYDDVY